MPERFRPLVSVLAGAMVCAALPIWILGLLLPFLSGTVKLLLVPVSRSFTLPAFISYLLQDGQTAVALSVILVTVLTPVALFVLLLPVARRLLGSAPLPGEGSALAARHAFVAAWLGRWSWILLAVNAVLVLGIKAGGSARATLRLRAGAPLLLGGLALAAGGAALGLLGARWPVAGRSVAEVAAAASGSLPEPAGAGRQREAP